MFKGLLHVDGLSVLSVVFKVGSVAGKWKAGFALMGCPFTIHPSFVMMFPIRRDFHVTQVIPAVVLNVVYANTSRMRTGPCGEQSPLHVCKGTEIHRGFRSNTGALLA